MIHINKNILSGKVLAASWLFLLSLNPNLAEAKSQKNKKIAPVNIAVNVKKNTPMANRRVEYFGKTIDSMCNDFVEKNNLPGLSLSTVNAPYISRMSSYGKSNEEKNLLVSPKTMFDIGQMARGYTMVAVMQLVEEGKIEVNDKVGKHLNNLPVSWNNITIKQLLQNSSGIADYTKTKGFNYAKNYTPAQLLDMVKETQLSFKAGDKVQKSNTDFLLLAMIIEKASGGTYKEYITKNQIEKLGLRHTGFVEDLAKFNQETDSITAEKRHAQFLVDGDFRFIDPVESALGYDKDNSPVTSRNTSSASLGTGGLWASPEDISFWDTALAGKSLIRKDENRNLVFKQAILEKSDGEQEAVPAMAGWNFTKQPGFTDIKGNVPGFSSYLSRFTVPTQVQPVYLYPLCVTLLTNKSGVDFTELGRKIAAAIYNQLGSGVDPEFIITTESAFSVAVTSERIKDKIKAMGMEIFAEYDHEANAQKVGESLSPTKVIIFGNAKIGTELMKEKSSIALDLPLRIAIIEEESYNGKPGRVWIEYPNMENIAKAHNVTNAEVIKKMEQALNSIAVSAQYLEE